MGEGFGVGVKTVFQHSPMARRYKFFVTQRFLCVLCALCS